MKLAFPVALASLFVALAALPVHAQGGIILGERPISRAEVNTFVTKQFARMDSSGDRHVSPAEFEAYRARQADAGRSGLARVGRRWFEKSDANVDGKVTLAEALARPLQMFDMADVDRDGIASLREQSFAQLLIGN